VLIREAIFEKEKWTIQGPLECTEANT
jgi:hypothetical protein